MLYVLFCSWIHGPFVPLLWSGPFGGLSSYSDSCDLWWCHRLWNRCWRFGAIRGWMIYWQGERFCGWGVPRLPTIVCWVLWKGHNAHIFYHVVADPIKLPEIALSLLFSWVAHIPLFNDVKYVDWVLGWDELVFPRALLQYLSCSCFMEVPSSLFFFFSLIIFFIIIYQKKKRRRSGWHSLNRKQLLLIIIF